MSNLHLLNHSTAQAIVPEQLVPYVQAMGENKIQFFENCIGYIHNDFVVMVAYAPVILDEIVLRPENSQLKNFEHIQKAIDNAVELALSLKNLKKITVLAPVKPSIAPDNAKVIHDVYWGMKLPAPLPKQKLRNMLNRARRDLVIKQDLLWSDEHENLIKVFCKARHLETGTRYIFQNLKKYVHSTCSVINFSAYNKNTNKLEAFTLGDYSSMTTVFYMFAFRDIVTTPGVNDLLLNAVCAEGTLQGHSMLNLGLGINQGISFFKKKWQAQPLLPYIQSSWDISPKRWWSRLISAQP